MSEPNAWRLLERAEREHGAGVAVRRREGERTWNEVADRARARAVALAARLEPGERVAVLADNTPEHLELVFAAAGAGLVLQPLNGRLAPAELVLALRDAGARLLLADDAHGELANALAEEVEIARLGPEPPPARGALDGSRLAAADDPAQLYPTSGTTGEPKGVVLTHRNVVRHAENAAVELALGPADVWGHFAPMFHLADAWATLAVTAVGGAHAFVPRFDARAVAEELGRAGVTLTNLVPTMISRLLDHLATHPSTFEALRLVLSGGAPIVPSQVAEIERAFGCEYAQTYGMTETSPYLTISLPRTPDEERGLSDAERLARRARTGRSFRGVELEVRGEDGRPVPADDCTVGEIHVRGETVTPGYWRRPEATARAFVDGWLATGDLAVVDEGGRVDIRDRKKDMILTGGENVYSTEVENALVSHPAVSRAAAFGLADEAWGERVCAAVVLAPGTTIDPDGLRRHCQERLARFKVPREVHVVDELPLTGSGKVHKPTLRQRFGADRIDAPERPTPEAP